MRIAVSGLNNTDNPAPGIPVVKSLRSEHELFGLSYDPNEPGNYMGLTQKNYLMPYPSQGIEETIERLEYIKADSGIEALIPNLDAELPLYIKYQKRIEGMGIKLCLPSLENFELRNKNRLGELSDMLKIDYPITQEVNSVTELQDTIDQMRFPLMIKGNYYKAYKAYNLGSAIDYFYKISNEWGFPILVQEVVEGEELNLVGVGDGKGTLCGAVTIKKLSTTEIGKIWTGITIRNDAFMEVAKAFVRSTRWKGPFELECIVNQQKIHMIEINPRFPAWVYFATEIGVNLPKMVIELMEDKAPMPITEYPQHKLYVRFTGEMVTNFSDFTTLLSQKER